MKRYIVQRLLYAFVTIWFVATATFLPCIGCRVTPLRREGGFPRFLPICRLTMDSTSPFGSNTFLYG